MTQLTQHRNRFFVCCFFFIILIIAVISAGCGGGGSKSSVSTPPPTSPPGGDAFFVETFDSVPNGTDIQANPSTLDNSASFPSTDMPGPIYAGTAEGGQGTIALDNRGKATDPAGADAQRIAFKVPNLSGVSNATLRLTVKNAAGTTKPITIYVGNDYSTSSPAQNAYGTYAITSSTYYILEIPLAAPTSNVIQIRPQINSGGKWSGTGAGGIYIDRIEVVATSSSTPTSPGSPVDPGTPIYVSTNGLASNPGTIDSPTTLESAIAMVSPGGTIFMRGGTYNYSATITIPEGNNGASGNLKTLSAYAGETPILNFSVQTELSTNRGLQLYGNYWHIQGLIVERAGDNGIFVGGSHNVIERCTTRYNRDSGLQLGRISSSYQSISQWPSYNLILNCDSYDNSDSDGEDADGFACKLTTGYGNVFRGCIAHNNSDDGWDLYTKSDTGVIGPVTIEDCVSYSNGILSSGTLNKDGDGNGYKLGSSSNAVSHIVRRCIAFYNRKHGFTDNSNPGPIDISNCTSWHNSMSMGPTTQTTEEYNFAFSKGAHFMTNNLSWEGGGSDVGHVPSGSTASHNVFYNKDKKSYDNDMGVTLTAADFAVTPSYTFGAAPISRNADGSINYGFFLQLAADSDLKGKGVNGRDIGARGNVGNDIAIIP